MVDYDVVIIGGSPAGIYAAVTATFLKARVALVASQLSGSTWSDGSKYSKALVQVSKVVHQVRSAKAFGVDWEAAETAEKISVGVRFTDALKWAKAVVSTLDEQHSPAVLAALGVDVIFGAGEFCRLPHLAFVVNGEALRSRAYLIASGSRTAIPDIEGLSGAGYLTADTILTPTKFSHPPESLIVIGGDPIGVELAQTFARLGSNVTLAANGSHILTREDAEATFLIQAQLEAEGVRVLTGDRITQVRWIQDRKWIQVGDRAIEADEILVADRQQPNVDGLNLAGVGVKVDSFGIATNYKLQTTNPRIYACGDVLGGYRFAHWGNYEARIALKNLLFFPIFKVDYRYLPRAIFSDPELAAVGLTEEQALRQYGDEVMVLRRSFKGVDKAQMCGETTGFCKILARRNGEIIGAHLVGLQASESIHAIALAMQQGVGVKALARLVHIFPSLSEINAQTASDWSRQRFSKNTFRQDFLEGFFNFRRSRSS